MYLIPKISPYICTRHIDKTESTKIMTDKRLSLLTALCLLLTAPLYALTINETGGWFESG